jgi:DNA-binding PadR family transcriptional regulator
MVPVAMRRPSYFILAALLDGPLHGYAIAARAGELSEGDVRLSAGTLYGALDRLAAEGLVEEAGEEVVQGRRRRIHRLTDAGRDAVVAEAGRLRSAAAAVDRRLPAARHTGPATA